MKRILGFDQREAVLLGLGSDQQMQEVWERGKPLYVES